MANIRLRPGQVVILGVIITALLTGCARSAGATTARPLVATTFTVLADIARNVGGEHVVVESITKVGAEIHAYEPTPGDLRRVRDAAMILDNGMGLEAWFDRFLEDAGVDHVVVSEGVQAIPIADGDYAGRPNPHAWMSPRNVQTYVDNVVTAFSGLDPAHADSFRANGEAYKRELEAVHQTLLDGLATVPPDGRLLVTCEGAFSYLTRDAAMSEGYLWAVNAEQQATPARVAALVDRVRAAALPSVFCESTVSSKAMEQVADATGAEFGGVLYVDSLSAPDGPVPTYLDLIRHDVSTIVRGLSGSDR